MNILRWLVTWTMKFLSWLKSLLWHPLKVQRLCYFCGHKHDELYSDEYGVEYADNPVHCPECRLNTAYIVR